MRTVELMRTDVPEWYRLGSTGTTLRIDVHPVVIPDLLKHNTLMGDRTAVGPYPLPEFVSLGNSSWGYGGVIRQTRLENGWTRFSISCPNGQPGEASTWSRFYAVAASLQIVFQILSVTELAPEAGPPQLFVVTGLGCRTEIAGSSLYVAASQYVARWISRQAEGQILCVAHSIRRTYDRMSGGRTRLYWHGCRLQPPMYLHLSVHGDANSLDPDQLEYQEMRGYKLWPHNLDSPVQQFPLLVGLGTLSDIIRHNP